MSIRFKLFVVLLLTTLTLVGGMYSFMRWSLDSGFSRFMEKRQEERIENLLDSLGDYYAEHNSWQALSQDRHQWLVLLWQSNRHHHQIGEWRHLLAQPENNWPPEPPPLPLPDQPETRPDEERAPFEWRVMLLDAEQRPLIGRGDLIPQCKLYAIEDKDQLVGYLAVLPGKPVILPLERQFYNQQNRTFIAIAFAMLLLSALLAMGAAYFLGKPLKRIAEVVRQLAVGNFQPRLVLPSKDELGRLAHDINDLAYSLEQNQGLRRQWVADISHELRTPLAVLRAQLESMQDGIRPLDAQSLQTLLNEVLRLGRLTDDLYQLALSDQNSLSYQKQVLNLAVLLQSALDDIRDEFAGRGLDLSINLPQSPINVLADADRLMQVLRNVLNNSLHYTDRGGTVRVTLQLSQDFAWVTLEDSAPGVAAENLPKLFQRFYRVEVSRSREHGGAGLGLALCQNIVEAHQGTIGAEASKLGGLKITIGLPEYRYTS
jgi:two-component system, OmpR family, sensor histidine kinase BaeS